MRLYLSLILRTHVKSQPWGHTLIIPSLSRQRQKSVSTAPCHQPRLTREWTISQVLLPMTMVVTTPIKEVGLSESQQEPQIIK